MSKEFVENHLFKPFSQENSFKEGTGLGMSLVAKIVAALGGQIEVRSEKGVGTTTVVRIPLDRSRPSSEESAKLEHLEDRQRFRDITIGLVNVNDTENSPFGASLQLASLQKTCTELGLRSRKLNLSDLDTRSADIFMVTEALARHVPQTFEQSATKHPDTRPLAGILENKPLILLCDTPVSAHELRALRTPQWTSSHVEFIPQPGGPGQLTRAVRACLRPNSTSRHRDSGAGIAEGTADEKPKVGFELKEVAKPPALPFRAAGRPKLLQGSSSDPVSPMTIRPQPAIPEQPAESAQADLKFKSDARKGSLPLLKPTNSAAQLEETQMRVDEGNARPKPPARSETVSPGLPILIVDDNQINLQLLVTYAKKHNHRKTTAQDGLQAVEAYKAACHGGDLAKRNLSPIQGLEEYVTLEQPKVVLMDINMPVLNGFEATRQIRQFEQQSGLEPAKIIALTGLGSAEAQQEAFSSGVDLFLMKPVRLKELTAILDDVSRA